MSDRPTVYVQNLQSPQPSSNGLGVAGFVLSLVGYVTCGLLCPLGVILSAVGLRKEPRGLAIAGLVLGLIGSVVPLALFLIWGISIFSCLTLGGAGAVAVRLEARTATAITDARNQIETYRTTHGALPDDIGGNTEIMSDRDAWGHSLRYKRLNANQFEIRSSGSDGIFETSDDRTQIFNEPVAPETER
jgi:hypothetical protein